MRVLLSLFALVALSHAVSVTPTQKVISLLTDMIAKGKSEKDAEAKTFDTFSEWCHDTVRDKGYEIKDDKAMIEKQAAIIAKAESDVGTLIGEISELDQAISGWEADKAKATALRASENDEYKSLHQDYSESIFALGKAIQTLKNPPTNIAQSLLQLRSVATKSSFTSSAKASLASFLEGFVQPEANAYESSSGNIINMLTELKEKFDEEMDALVKDEKNKKHAFNMMELDLVDQIENASSERAKKAVAKADAEQTGAEATKAHAGASDELKADEKYTSDTKTECAQKTTDFGNRQQLRGEEIEALTKAVDILSGDSVSGSADKHLPSLAQKGVSFVQISKQDKKREALELLQASAAKNGSKALAQLAARISMTNGLDDPFVKVRGMIQGMIEKLNAEAAAEAEEKGWCDKELHDNKIRRTSKTEERDGLQAEVDELNSAIARLASEMAALEKAQAENNKALKEATDIRMEEKAKNEATIKDCKEAQVAVANAIEVLKEFYAKAAGATSFAQQRGAADDAPATFNKPYTGMQSGNGGVVGFLEVISSDFARVEADTTSSEAAAQQEYDQFSTDTKADNAAKHQEHLSKLRLKQKKEIKVERKTNKFLRRVQEEVDAANKYYDELKPTCLDSKTSYEERVQKREDEIASLNEAYKILSDL